MDRHYDRRGKDEGSIRFLVYEIALVFGVPEASQRDASPRIEFYEVLHDSFPILDLVEDDPGNPRLRRRRYLHPPIWGVVVSSRDAESDWLILWSETERGPLIHYVGEDLA